MKTQHTDIPLWVYMYKRHKIELHRHIPAYSPVALSSAADPLYYRGYIIYAPDSNRIVKTGFGYPAVKGWEDALLLLAYKDIDLRIEIGF